MHYRDELRAAKRIQLSYFLKVHQRGRRKLLGQVLDITEQGLNILSGDPIESGRMLSVLVELPETIYGKTRLALKVECRWCKPDINPSYYSIGFRFAQLTARELDLIRALIENYEFGRELQEAFL